MGVEGGIAVSDRPRLLDLFCGAGGASVGYHCVGFEVVGVDIRPQKHYPFEFHQADALTYPLDGFDVIHASPPCQRDSNGRNYNGKKRQELERYPELIEPTFARLKGTRKPFVVENVMGASHRFSYAIKICGTSLGLRVQRHRLFGSNICLFSAGLCSHKLGDVSVRRNGRQYLGRYRKVFTKKGQQVMRPYYCLGSEARKAMGIDWMNLEELGEAIPPAYTEFIGKQLMNYLKAKDLNG